ncbi:nucleic acid binding/RNA binding protein isoform X1 [Carex rostrata]
MDDLSIEELASNLSTYKDQLVEVKKLLADDPGNSEYADMEKELEEVIALTEELLTTARQNEVPQFNTAKSSIGGTTSMSEIASNRQSFSDGKYPVGTKVQAVWSDDGEWYDATIEAHTPIGYFVSYDNWGNNEEVDPANVRLKEEEEEEGEVDALQEAEREAVATREAIKRKIQQAAVTTFQPPSLPTKLRIDPNDPDEVKAAKKKKIHAFKSKVRQEQIEVVQNKRQNSWQQFQNSKGKTKKVGFFSGRKRESIFKSPDDPKGKVGVTGSGKGLTDFQKREKHLHLKGSSYEGPDADE